MRDIMTDGTVPFPYTHRMGWLGLSLADAFRPGQRPGVLVAARRLFITQYERARLVALHAMGCFAYPPHTPFVPLQTAPCHSNWPEEASPQAAIGLTCYLESRHLTDYLILQSLARRKSLNELKAASELDGEAIEEIVIMVARSIESRLLTAILTRRRALAALSCYRVFIAAQQDLRLSTLKEIVEAAVLYGDLLPPMEQMRMHPVTRSLIAQLLLHSAPYLTGLDDLDEDTMKEFGVDWTYALCRVIVPYISLPKEPQSRSGSSFRPSLILPFNQPPAPVVNERERKSLKISPPRQPGTDGGDGTSGETNSLNNHSEDEQIKNEFLETILEAIRPNNSTPFGSSEHFSVILRNDSFEKGPEEEVFPHDHVLYRVLETYAVPHQEISERILHEHGDSDAFRALDRRARPLAREIAKLLYKDRIQERPFERRQCSGALDPSRLACAAISDAVYRRRVVSPGSNGPGRPVIAIAGDASSSLNRKQSAMVQLLLASWLQGLQEGRVELLCGLYSGYRNGPELKAIPRINWVKHPRLTPFRDSVVGTRALAGFTSGSGIQSDALSIRHIIREARRFAFGNRVYLVLITDAEWRKSFHTKNTPTEEIRSMIAEVKQHNPEQLHITLIVLGDHRSGIDNLVDEVLRVRDAELTDIEGTTRKVAEYVARMLKRNGVRI